MLFQAATALCLIGAMHFTAEDLLLAVASFLAGCAIMGWLKREKKEFVKARSVSADIGNFCLSIGLPHVGGFFKAFSIDDPETMWIDAQGTIQILKDPALRAAAMMKVANIYMSEAKMNNPAEVSRMISVLNGTAQAAAQLALLPVTLDQANGIAAMLQAGYMPGGQAAALAGQAAPAAAPAKTA